MESNNLSTELQEYANLHILRSFEHLLVSVHFANYVNNRPGYEQLFRKLSDEAWEDGIDLMKHVGMRGVKHNFTFRTVDPLPNSKDKYEHYELPAMSRAVDVQKHLANEAMKIHATALRRHENVHDAEIAQYIEEKFAEKHAKEVSTLVGHVSDLTKFSEGNDMSLALHMFDEYLQKA